MLNSTRRAFLGAAAAVSLPVAAPADPVTAGSREAAIAALTLALDVDMGVYGCDAADSMIRAALGYLEG